MRLKWILIAVAVIAASFVISLKTMDWLSPDIAGAPELAALPPLPPFTRKSTIVAPVAITLKAIRDSADRAAPRKFSGTAPNPVPQLLQNANIAWTAARGAITVTGAQNVLALATPLTGALAVTGALSVNAKGALGDALGKLLGGNVAKQVGNINIKQVNANADLSGSVTMTARPAIAENWRIHPNLAAEVNLGNTSVAVAGIRVDVPASVKPVIDKAVEDQLRDVQQRISNDPALEQAVRREWSKACRSVPLQGATATPKGFWLELRPVAAVASQPRTDFNTVSMTLGIEAETRLTTAETRPDFGPFPAALRIVPPSPGRISVVVPFDMSFADVSALLTGQLAGKTFPETGNAPVTATIKRVAVAASGDRLLISLAVDATDSSSLFNLGSAATVHIWAKPMLDAAQQIVRLTEVRLAVEIDGAAGLLGIAARAAAPLLQQAIADNATIDLKPFAANAQKRIGDVARSFTKSEDGIRVNADITRLQLSGLAFDSTTLRVVAEAEGSASVEISSLPGL